MHHEHEASSSGFSRRTIVKAAAWSAPVVAVAAATPAAAASTVQGIDLFADGLQMGSELIFFSTDLATRYIASEPMGFTLLNKGADTAPAGSVTVQARYDNRIYTPTGVDLSVGGSTEAVAFDIVSVDGNASTISFVIPREMPTETSVFGANAMLVFTRFEADIAYPNDTYDGYIAPQWTIMSADDSDVTNNVYGPWTPASEPAAPWGLTLAAETSTLSAGSCSAEVASTVTIESIGPNPTPTAANGRMYVDAGLISNVSISSATLNGTDITSDVDFSRNEFGSYDYTLGQTLAAGDTVVLSVDYEVISGGTTDGSATNQVFVTGTDESNDRNKRQTVSYFDVPGAVCTP